MLYEVITLGQKGGQEAVTLTVANLPSHSHTVSVTAYGQSAAGNADGPGGNTWAAKSRGGQYSSTAPNVAMSAGSVQATVGNTGGNQAFSIVQPYVVLRPLITLYGIYPSRITSYNVCYTKLLRSPLRNGISPN